MIHLDSFHIYSFRLLKMQKWHFQVFVLLFPFLLIAQTKQKDLEERKKALIEQIKQMSELRSQQTQQRKSTILQIEEANEKIQMRSRLIQITQQQANLLSKEIDENEKVHQTDSDKGTGPKFGLFSCFVHIPLYHSKKK